MLLAEMIHCTADRGAQRTGAHINEGRRQGIELTEGICVLTNEALLFFSSETQTFYLTPAFTQKCSSPFFARPQNKNKNSAIFFFC